MPSDAVPATGPVVLAPLTGDASAYASLTFPRLAPRLVALTPPWLAVGATLGGVPVGFALGHACEGEVQLLSVVVAPSLRGQGLGRRLIAAFADRAAATGARGAVIAYSSRLDAESAAALVSAATAAGWSAPTLRELICFSETGSMVESVGRWPAVSGRLRDAKKVDFAPWHPLDDADHAAIAAMADDEGYLPHMHPDRPMAPPVPECSVAVRRDGALVGWVMAEQAPTVPLPGYRDRPAITYRSAYLRADLWHTGALVGAYWHAFDRQAALLGARSIAIYHTCLPRMMAMVRRRFGPLHLRVDEAWELKVTLRHSSQ